MSIKLKPPGQRNPTCFGTPYKGFFRFFVIYNMMHNLFCIVIVIRDIVITIQALQVLKVFPMNEKIKLYFRGFGWAWFSLHCIISFILDTRLLQTAALPSIRFLRFYSLFHCISLPLFFIYYYVLLIIGSSVLPYPHILATALLPYHLFYRVYTSYIVFRYSQDIDFEIQMKSGYRNLTDAEVDIFHRGISLADEKISQQQKYIDSSYDLTRFQVYKKEEFEIDMNDLDFSESITLGCGQYGCVYKVIWNNGKNNDGEAVAVKTVDPERSDVNQFKALLTEAKVMMTMGRHENVVKLLGICTEEIRERKLFIVCELCEFGNLRAHLRSERSTFVNLNGREEKVERVSLKIIESGVTTTIDLIRWCFEIAAGMDFLAARKIIHGDLAARNVLVTSSKTAKITDFGLSRRLYNYNVYRKQETVPLPWRWLALESLVDMNFSTGSDVWSFGVVCWEIFELGARPWPEFGMFTSDFIDALKDGKVLGKSKFCTEEIYEIMCSCWMRKTNQRPTFLELKQDFYKILKEMLPGEKFTMSQSCNEYSIV